MASYAGEMGTAEQGFSLEPQRRTDEEYEVSRGTASTVAGAAVTAETAYVDPCAEPNNGVPISVAVVDQMGTE